MASRQLRPRDPCPGCGRLIAYSLRGKRKRWEHRCSHGRPCIGHRAEGIAWRRGDWRHFEACAQCCDAARVDMPRTIYDCRACNAPLPFDEHLYPRPPVGAVTLAVVRCMRCSEPTVYCLTPTRVERVAAPLAAVAADA